MLFRSIMVTVGLGLGLYGLTRVLPGKAAFVETKINSFERGITAVCLSAVIGVRVENHHSNAPANRGNERDPNSVRSNDDFRL